MKNNKEDLRKRLEALINLKAHLQGKTPRQVRKEMLAEVMKKNTSK